MTRKSDYKPEYAEQARKMCLLGATNIEIADFFGTSNASLLRWMRANPELKSAMRAGKLYANAVVADKLYQRATGYSCEETLVKVIAGKIHTVKVTKNYPPETLAMIYFLKNRDKERWRDKHEVDHSGTINYSNLTDEELERKIAELAKG